MTTSPYDNLPIGKKEESADTMQYQEAVPEMQETDTPLHYVDVEIEDAPEPAQALQAASAQEMKPAPQPQESANAAPPAALAPENTAPPAASAPAPAKLPKQPKQPKQPNQAHKAKQAAQGFAKTEPFDKAPQYSNISVQNMWDVREYILPFEESLLVPDTMPDMERMLFAEAAVQPAQTKNQSYGKDDFLAGDITVFAVYRPVSESGSPVDVVKSIIPFKTDKCWGDGEADVFKAEVSVKSISAEMINERKFIAKGELLIRLTEIARKELKIFKGAEDDDLALAESSIQITDMDFELQSSAEISQDVNIKESQPSPVKILMESIRAVENHRQITSGKLVINASIYSQVLYLGEEGGQRRLGCLTNKTDFTQFVLIKNDVDTALMKITFNTDDLKMTIENQNMFLLQGTISTSVCGYKNMEVRMVSDAYHKVRDIRFDVASQELSAVKDIVSGEISAREVIDLEETGKKPDTLLCGFVQTDTIQGRIERGRVIIEGALPVTMLALDENETPFVINASLPLRGSLDTTASGDALTADISAALKEFWFDEINSRQLEINVSVAINARVYGREAFDAIENLCFAVSEEPQQRVSMAVYVTGQNETLWDVAKRYKCDADAIAQLNQLEPQSPLSEGMKLFIAR